MTANNKTPGLVPSGKRRGRGLRITAAIVLLLGIFGADAVYWLGTRSANSSDDPSQAGYDKAQARQAEILYGKQAILIKDWSDDLKRPGTQAWLIVVAAALVAGGCLYLARLLDQAEQHAEEIGSHHG